MEISVSARMGGPELRAPLQTLLVQLRRELKRWAAPVTTVGLTDVSYRVFVNGSVTQYAPEGGVLAARYRRAESEMTVDVCVTSAEVLDRTPDEVVAVLRERFIDSAAHVAGAAHRSGIVLDGPALASVIGVAFDQLLP